MKAKGATQLMHTTIPSVTKSERPLLGNIDCSLILNTRPPAVTLSRFHQIPPSACLDNPRSRRTSPYQSFHRQMEMLDHYSNHELHSSTIAYSDSARIHSSLILRHFPPSTLVDNVTPKMSTNRVHHPPPSNVQSNIWSANPRQSHCPISIL